MTGRKIRRKVRKRKTAVENSRMKLWLFFGIIALTVGLGFLTARFVIGPLIGYNAEESPVQKLAEQKSKDAAKTSAQQDSTKEETTADQADAASQADAANQADAAGQMDEKAAGQTDEKAAAEADGKQQKEGYVLQFGAFSTKAAAQELSDALQAKGIKTRVVEIDSVFKVLSPVTEQKESALQALQEAKEKNVSEVFIAAMEG
mgnify:CR=1 FL=1